MSKAQLKILEVLRTEKELYWLTVYKRCSFTHNTPASIKLVLQRMIRRGYLVRTRRGYYSISPRALVWYCQYIIDRQANNFLKNTAPKGG